MGNNPFPLRITHIPFPLTLPIRSNGGWLLRNCSWCCKKKSVYVRHATRDTRLVIERGLMYTNQRPNMYQWAYRYLADWVFNDTVCKEHGAQQKSRHIKPCNINLRWNKQYLESISWTHCSHLAHVNSRGFLTHPNCSPNLPINSFPHFRSRFSSVPKRRIACKVR